MTSPERRLEDLGITLPTVRPARGTYVACRQAGPMLYLSGQTPRTDDDEPICGKVGIDVSVTEAQRHARRCALQLLAVAKVAVGDLSRVSVVKLFGMVNAAPDFADHAKVIDGASDLLVEVMGERGAHARSAVGLGSLPRGVTVEVEAIFEVDRPSVSDG